VKSVLSLRVVNSYLPLFFIDLANCIAILYLLQASKSAAHHDEVQMGLFYAILTEPKLASRVR